MTPQKINYQKELEKIIAQIEEEKKTTVSFIKPTLLLHACCGPCSSYVIEYLAQIFDITIYYYNPNIHPKEEYFRRLEELKKFLERFPQATQNSVKLVEDSYNLEEYFEATNVRQEVELQSEPEKGERCRRCYLFRMKRAWEYACKNNFDWFTTTLSISPHKDSEKINVIGRELEEQKTNDSSAITIHTKFLPSDFKKKGGFLRSTQLSEEYGLWRQDYCGCVFSQRNGKKDL
ncbi:MAG: epoxyqueuosine reductase QueH [Treponema sp.]|uniref:epoxyqueuosine reductase QueH n=1 Tax=Treponema sp. TaxID=166 RepID=UPI0025DD199D|nr:epoxyqueuosine reductase QueH [Treponema sp.]MBQ8678152.1 epoxyqueuosine reductase QueH [Treponema sp.]